MCASMIYPPLGIAARITRLVFNEMNELEIEMLILNDCNLHCERVNVKTLSGL